MAEYEDKHSSGAIWFNTLLIWTPCWQKMLSGFCTSAKTHILHNLQSMSAQHVQALFFPPECDLLNLYLFSCQCSLYWHTHCSA